MITVAVVGIDLGTTNTVVACVRDGRVHVLADEDGQRLLPSVVSFHPNNGTLVGRAARARRIIDAKNTVYSVKRLLGRAWNSPELAEARARFPFALHEGPGHAAIVRARGQDYTLPEISAFVLKRAKQIAERALGEPVDRAVITVPAHFNELQRASTKVAGRVAGLEVLRLLNEPTAAALVYGMGRKAGERIAVYDFGGGTFDCTLLEVADNVFEVLATAGDSFLGGDDIDQAIAERMSDQLLREQRVDARADTQLFARLRAAAEQVKIALSSLADAEVNLDEISYGPGGRPIHFVFRMTRAELESLAASWIDKTFAVAQDALGLARLTPTSFDRVVLVGGSTRIPLVRQRVEAFFGVAPLDRINPEEVVAVGAAIQAAALSEPIQRRSIPPPPEPLRAEAEGNAAVPRPSVRPPQVSFTETQRMQPHPLGSVPPPRMMDPADEPTLSNFSKPQTMISAAPPPPPTERDVMAPTIPSAPPPKRSPSYPGFSGPPLPYPLTRPLTVPPPPAAPVLIDVTPRALVVETAGNYCDVIIARNAQVPSEHTRHFTTVRDMQTTVLVRVAQGEHPHFAENTYLGEVRLTGLPAGKRGDIVIAVTFELDVDGTLQVRARDAVTGRLAEATLHLVGISDDHAVGVAVRRVASQPLLQ